MLMLPECLDRKLVNATNQLDLCAVNFGEKFDMEMKVGSANV